MKVKNISSKNIQIANFYGEDDHLNLTEGQTSADFICNKRQLNDLIENKDDIQIIICSAKEMEFASELDPRIASFCTLE